MKLYCPFDGSIVTYLPAGFRETRLVGLDSKLSVNKDALRFALKDVSQRSEATLRDSSKTKRKV